MYKKVEKPSKEELEEMYNNLKSSYKVSKRYGVHSSTIINWLKNYGIRVRERLKLSSKSKKPSKEELSGLYNELRSSIKLSKLYRCSHKTILNWLNEYDIETLTASECKLPKGVKKPNKDLLRKLYEDIGTISGVAQTIGVSDVTISRWMKSYHIQKKDENSPLDRMLNSYVNGGQDD